jgi:hypothetical protein
MVTVVEQASRLLYEVALFLIQGRVRNRSGAQL